MAVKNAEKPVSLDLAELLLNCVAVLVYFGLATVILAWLADCTVFDKERLFRQFLFFLLQGFFFQLVGFLRVVFV